MDRPRAEEDAGQQGSQLHRGKGLQGHEVVVLFDDINGGMYTHGGGKLGMYSYFPDFSLHLLMRLFPLQSPSSLLFCASSRLLAVSWCPVRTPSMEVLSAGPNVMILLGVSNSGRLSCCQSTSLTVGKMLLDIIITYRSTSLLLPLHFLHR